MNEPHLGQDSSEAQHGETPPERAPEARPRSSTIGIGSSIGVGCLIVVVLFVVAAFAIRSIFGSW